MDVKNARKEFLDQLTAHRLLIPSGVPGLYGRGPLFEDVLQQFNRLLTEVASGDGAEGVWFPPLVNRQHYEQSGFLKSFPHLAGSVFSFEGTQSDYAAFVSCLDEGRDWSSFQKMTEVMFTSAACYPIYPMATGILPEGGRLFDVCSYCFRHEPSDDPARMQVFRMREFVHLGTPETAMAFRRRWMERGGEILKALEVPLSTDVASDPFFGRGGKMMAVNQKDQQLKFEIRTPITSVEEPTAVMSFNYHQDHFGDLFNIKNPSGEIAHTACFGAGLERVVLALFKTHGMSPESWPVAVRSKLWP